MRYRQNPVTLDLEPMDEAAYFAVHHVMPEIHPYQSMKDGTWITSRAQHQEHLKRHDCFEVGNEVAHITGARPLDPDPKGEIKDAYKRVVLDNGFSQFRKQLNREIEFVKWNSRGLPRS